MPIPVETILEKASIILNDEDFVRWTESELIGWLNDAAGEVVIRRPQARLLTKTIELVAGPHQNLPAGAIQLVDIIRNIPGRAISRAQRRLLDDQIPDWYDMRPTYVVRQYTLEDEAPTAFFVYPPVIEGVKVEARYSEAPPVITDRSETLELDAIYTGPIVNYMLYRALAKDSEYANGNIAMTHFQAFNEALGVNAAVSSAVGQVAGTQ